MNNNITLFSAAQSVREALADVDPDSGEFGDDYTASRELFERKGAACLAYLVEEDASIEASEKLLNRMADNLAARKRGRDRFRYYMADCMKATGVTKLSADGLITATLYPDRDESIELDPSATFPLDLCADPKPPAPSKAKIRAAILAGQPVAGARIVRKDRLTIR